MSYQNSQKNINNTINLLAVGDVSIHKENPDKIFSLCSSKFNNSDINFCNLEATLFRGPDFSYRIFDVASANGNHFSDGALDTMNILKENGVQPLGVGKNINEARKPVVIDRAETRVAFLSYNCVLMPQCAANNTRPGGVPLGIHTFYEPTEIFPGSPGKVITFPKKSDLDLMRDDIKKAKLVADIVAISIHWGMLFKRAVLADYQSEVSYAAIDAGADVILGHHTHILKGIEVYKGKAIFYSLGDFVFVQPPEVSDAELSTAAKYGLTLDPDDPKVRYFPTDSRKTMISKITIADKKIKRVSFLPVFTNTLWQPEVLKFGDSKFAEVVQYVKDITKEANLNTKFNIDGDEVIVVTE